MNSTISEDVLDILAEMSGVHSVDIKDSDVLTSDLNLDSMDLIEVHMMLEERFEIQIPDSSIKSAMTVTELIEEVGKIKGGA